MRYSKKTIYKKAQAIGFKIKKSYNADYSLFDTKSNEYVYGWLNHERADLWTLSEIDNFIADEYNERELEY